MCALKLSCAQKIWHENHYITTAAVLIKIFEAEYKVES